VLLLCLLALNLQIDYNISSAHLQARFQAKRFVVAETIRAAVALILPLILFALLHRRDHVVLLAGFTAGAAIGALIARAGYPSVGKLPLLHQDRETGLMLRRIAAYGIPLAVSSGIIAVNSVLDRSLIALLLNMDAVGVYAATYDIVYKVFGLFLWPVLLAAQPIIMKQWNSCHYAEALSTIATGIRCQLLGAALLLPALYLASPLLGRLLFKTNVAGIGATLIPFAVAATAWQVATFIHKPVELSASTWVLVKWSMITVLTTALCDLALLPVIGYPGAAYAAMIGGLVYITLALRWNRRWKASRSRRSLPRTDKSASTMKSPNTSCSPSDSTAPSTDLPEVQGSPRSH
jgi:O-antigen/teichoic acid export membrane protein